MNMNTRHKFLLIFFILVSIFMILVRVFDTHTNQMTLLKEAISHSYKLNSDVLILRKNEKNFLTRLTWDELKKFQTHAAILQSDLSYLSRLMSDNPHLAGALDSIQGHLDLYKNTFFSISEAYEKIGIDYDHGLKGKVKQNFLKLEAFLWELENEHFSYRDTIESYEHEILKLTLQEKNFLLRPSQKYVQRFKDQVESLEESLADEKFLSQKDRQIFSTLLTEYISNFYHLSQLILDLDYSPNSPIVSLSHYARDLEMLVQQISSKIVDELIVSEKGARTYSTLIMLSFAFGLLSIAIVPFLLLMMNQKRELHLIEEQV